MLAFVHCQKTGGMTITWMLRSSFGVRHCDIEAWECRYEPVSASDLRYAQKLHPRLESIAGHRVYAYSDMDQLRPDIVYFTLFRDPATRCASFYQMECRNKQDVPDFEDWLWNSGVSNQQTKAIAGQVSVEAAIDIIRQRNVFVGLTERFDESMLLLKQIVCSKLNIGYESKNVSRDNTIARELLSSHRIKSMLIEANQADVELYQFVSRELLPAYIRQYGGTWENDLSKYRHDRGRPDQTRIAVNRLYRNIIYRPALRFYRLLHPLRHTN
jgi:hypothetical protein